MPKLPLTLALHPAHNHSHSPFHNHFLGHSLTLTLTLSTTITPTSSSISTSILYVLSLSGHVHAGMYRGALGILDGYGMRGYLIELASKGYDIKIVGHSLGAGKYSTYIAINTYSTYSAYSILVSTASSLLSLAFLI